MLRRRTRRARSAGCAPQARPGHRSHALTVRRRAGSNPPPQPTSHAASPRSGPGFRRPCVRTSPQARARVGSRPVGDDGRVGAQVADGLGQLAVRSESSSSRPSISSRSGLVHGGGREPGPAGDRSGAERSGTSAQGVSRSRSTIAAASGSRSRPGSRDSLAACSTSPRTRKGGLRPGYPARDANRARTAARPLAVVMSSPSTRSSPYQGRIEAGQEVDQRGRGPAGQRRSPGRHGRMITIPRPALPLNRGLPSGSSPTPGARPAPRRTPTPAASTGVMRHTA